jgi:LysR family glycine cleavage system transcriptional activator
MRRRLPPFAAIRAFEAAARHRSFTEAAAELHVTQSAISHQVRSLEEFLATPLFLREPHGIELTRAGREYLRDLTDLLDRLDASTQRLRTPHGSEPLRIRATPAFAARWLVPRMDRFFEQHPGVEWQLSTAISPSDFAKGDVDVIIHWGTDPVPGARIDPLLESARAPVASPALLRTLPRLRAPADLLQVTLLHDEIQDGWGDWFAARGITTARVSQGPRFAHCELTLTAAETGQGVALAYTALIERELEARRLARLFERETPPLVIYSLAYLESRSSCPRISAFRSWIFREVSRPAPLARRAVGT